MKDPDEEKFELRAADPSGLIRKMDQRLELVDRLLAEIQTRSSGCDEYSLKELDRIDVEMANQFLSDPESTDLSTPHLIDDDAAAALSRHRDDLALSGLTELSDAAAEALSRHQYLSLTGLRS